MMLHDYRAEGWLRRHCHQMELAYVARLYGALLIAE